MLQPASAVLDPTTAAWISFFWWTPWMCSLWHSHKGVIYSYCINQISRLIIDDLGKQHLNLLLVWTTIYQHYSSSIFIAFSTPFSLHCFCFPVLWMIVGSKACCTPGPIIFFWQAHYSSEEKMNATCQRTVNCMSGWFGESRLLWGRTMHSRVSLFLLRVQQRRRGECQERNVLKKERRNGGRKGDKGG